MIYSVASPRPMLLDGRERHSKVVSRDTVAQIIIAHFTIPHVDVDATSKLGIPSSFEGSLEHDIDVTLLV